MLSYKWAMISRLCSSKICKRSSMNNILFYQTNYYVGIRLCIVNYSVEICVVTIFSKFSEELLETQNISLHDWVNKERFPVFMKLSPGNFHQVMKTKKYIVIAVLEENQIGGLTLKMTE